MFLEEKDLLFFKYYGCKDYLGRYFLKNVLDNLDLIEANKKEINVGINSIETLYNNLWINTYSDLIKDLPNYDIEESLKNRLKTLEEEFNFDNSGFVNYINKNFEIVLDRNNHNLNRFHEFFESVSKLCFNKFYKGINKDFFLFFEKRFEIEILAYFENYSKYYSDKEEAIKKLFNNLKNTKIFDDVIYRAFLIKFKSKDDQFFKEQADFICKRTLNYIEKMKLTSDDQRIIDIQSLVQEYKELAIQYKLAVANSFVLLEKEIARILDEYIHKHGVYHEGKKIPLLPIVDSLKKDSERNKFLRLTLFKEGEVVKNYCDIVLMSNLEKMPLFESARDISRNRSNKYPYYKQDNINVDLGIRASIVNAMFNDETLTGEFANYLYNVTLELEKKYFSSLICIEKETSGIVDSIVNIINLAKINKFDTYFAKSLVVGTTYQICACIEKILRNVAYLEVKDLVFFDETITLHNILSSEFELKHVSHGLRYYLEFYLIKETSINVPYYLKPGFNFRNRLMHGDNDIYSSISYEVCIKMFYLLLSLINDLFYFGLSE